MTLRRRLVLLCSAIVLLTLALFALAIYLGAAGFLEGELNRSLIAAAQSVHEELTEEERFDHDEIPVGFVVGVYDQRGGVVYRSAGGPAVPPPLVQGAVWTDVQIGNEQYRQFVREGPKGLTIQVLRSRREHQEILRNLLRLFLLSFPLAGLAAGFGGWLMTTSVLDPLTQITRTAAALGADDLGRRLPDREARDELGELSLTFNAMLERLQRAFERQKQFAADAAHELRTPLAALIARAEVTLQKERSPEEYREALQKMQVDSENLAGLVRQLLSLARLETSAELEKVHFNQLVADVIQTLEPLAREAGLSLEFRQQGVVEVLAEPSRLMEVVVNLLDNAIQYSPRPGRIEVGLGRRDSRAEFWVHDEGPGIRPEDQGRIFDRFYRADKSRTHQSGQPCWGLGLSISKEIVVQLGGDISLESSPGAGTTFRVRLPVT